VIDLSSMGKGMIFLNGTMVSRYWTIPGTNTDAVLEGWGLPVDLSDGTQRYYRLPAEWLQQKNTLIFFEEFEGDPYEIRLCRPE
jgi:hypothetical protein